MESKSKLFRFLILPFCLIYFIVAIFLGGFPFNRYLIDSLFDPKIAILLAILCLLISRDVLQQVTIPQIVEFLICIAILAVAAYLRFAGIGQTIESGPTMDEPLIVQPVLKMIRTGDLDYRTYEYGGVCFYLLLAVFLIYGIQLLSSFSYHEFNEIPETAFYTAARFTIAFSSLLTVAVTYLIPRKFFGKLPAIIASLVISLSYLSFSTAHQVRLDVMLTLFVLVAHYFFLKILLGPSSLNYFLAGSFCGLSIGTKYSVLPILASLALAHFLNKKKSGFLNWNLILALASTIGFFLLFNFQPLLHLDEFTARLPRAVYHSLNPGHWSSTDNRPFAYLLSLAGLGIGYVALVTLLISLLTLFRKPDDRILLLWCFPILYLATIGSYPSGFPRYLLPVLPNFAILIGQSTEQLLTWLAGKFQLRALAKKLAIAAGIVLLCIFPVWNAMSFVKESKQRLQPGLVAQWIEKNIPENSIIMADPTGPVIREDKFQIVRFRYRDFVSENLRKADYVCVTEDLFKRIPSDFLMIQEFPARTKAMDRSVRIYKVPKGTN